jgi:hypothetical protein
VLTLNTYLLAYFDAGQADNSDNTSHLAQHMFSFDSHDCTCEFRVPDLEDLLRPVDKEPPVSRASRGMCALVLESCIQAQT